MSAKHFEGDLTVDKNIESNILTEGPKWVAKGLLDLKEHEQSTRGEPVSPNHKLAIGSPMFDKTPASEISPVNS